MKINCLNQPIKLLMFVNVYNEPSKKFLPMMHGMLSHFLQLSALREVILHKISDNKNGGDRISKYDFEWMVYFFYFEDSFLISIFGTKV